MAALTLTLTLSLTLTLTPTLTLTLPLPLTLNPTPTPIPNPNQVRAWRPQAVLVSAGFDAAAGDPLGEGAVTPAGFGRMTRALAHEVQGGRGTRVRQGGRQGDPYPYPYPYPYP